RTVVERQPVVQGTGDGRISLELHRNHLRVHLRLRNRRAVPSRENVSARVRAVSFLGSQINRNIVRTGCVSKVWPGCSESCSFWCSSRRRFPLLPGGMARLDSCIRKNGCSRRTWCATLT